LLHSGSFYADSKLMTRRIRNVRERYSEILRPTSHTLYSIRLKSVDSLCNDQWPTWDAIA
jgi:hypothetical protein